jgi:ribosome-associated translation inhibitor RaiA
MNTNEVVPVRTGSRGNVPDGAEELAVTKIRSVLRRVARPVLSARVTFTMSADPAVAFPAAAHATIDLNGRIVRAEATGQTMRAAIERMAGRLRVQMDRAVPARRSLASRRLPADGCKTDPWSSPATSRPGPDPAPFALRREPGRVTGPGNGVRACP